MATTRYETEQDLQDVAGDLPGSYLINDAHGTGWLAWDSEDGQVCLRPWDEDEFPGRSPISGPFCFTNADTLTYPITVTIPDPIS